ncbi:hypothetical protein ACFLZV_06920 [Candidatus Margulisiibacteriota bacterium]
MRTSLFKSSFSILGIILIMALLSCGKVTQVIKEKEEDPSFNLSYSVNIFSTQDIKEYVKKGDKEGNYFSVSDDDVYSQIIGIQEGGSRDELSWGKAVLIESKQETKSLSEKTIQKELSTPNSQQKQSHKKTYMSKSFRKDDIEMLKADYMWTKISFDKSQKWKISAKKIKKTYPAYMIRFFRGDKKFYLKVIDEEIVSKNKEVNIGDITLYDTFISVVYLMDIDQNKGSLIDAMDFNALSQILDNKFFNEITYELPVNKVKKFKPKKPVFIFSGQLESELIKLMKLLRAGETEESIKYVDKAFKDKLSKKARDILVKNIKTWTGKTEKT